MAGRAVWAAPSAGRTTPAARAVRPDRTVTDRTRDARAASPTRQRGAVTPAGHEHDGDAAGDDSGANRVVGRRGQPAAHRGVLPWIDDVHAWGLGTDVGPGWLDGGHVTALEQTPQRR